MIKNKKILIVFLGTFLVCLGLIYFFLDPSVYPMPRCPFYVLTGYLCPGCGSQRALHALLHLNFEQAFTFNPLMVLSLPYVMLWSVLYVFNKNNRFVLWLRVNLFGWYAVWLWGVVIVFYWIFRNL